EHGVNFIYYDQKKSNTFRPVELLTQIHDSIVFQIPLSIPWKQHADIVLKIKNSLEQPMSWRDREIPTPVSVSIGFNMSKKEMKELKSKDVPNDYVELSNKLEKIHSELI
ncbi:unnamed protein product, partial [marine sediment metagenome]